MKIFQITKKDCGEYCHEIHIVVATNLKEVGKLIAEKPWCLKIEDFDVVQLGLNKGIIYSDIY